MLLTYSLYTVGAIITRVPIEKGTMKSLGFTKKGIVKKYLFGFLVGMILIFLIMGICVLTGILKFNGFNNVLNARSIISIVLFLIAFLIQSMGEEVIFRGYLMTSITRKHSTTLAVIVNSLIFALLHVLNPGVTVLSIVSTFLIGIILSQITLKTGNIYAACGLHCAWNFFLTNFFQGGLANNEIETVIFNIRANHPKYDLISDIIVIAILVICIIVLGLVKFKKTEYVEPIKIETKPLPTNVEENNELDKEENVENTENKSIEISNINEQTN